MNKNILTIIPAAGRGSRMSSLTDNCAKSMIPISSKPLISYLLDQLIEEDLLDVVIVVGYKKETIIDYVNLCYKDKLNVTFVEQKELLGLGHALYQAVNEVNIEKYDGIFIMLGDAIFDTKSIFNFDKSYIACMDMVDYSRWCIAVKNDDNKLLYLLDKPLEKPERNLALVGAYYFDDASLFKKCTNEAIKKGIQIRNEYQISTAIEIYNNLSSIEILGLNEGEWLDFGEINEYNKNKRKINQSRIFNNIEYKDNVITKYSSSNKRKIQREIMWFLAMPKNLRKHIPKLVDYVLEDSNPKYSMEYCSYNTVQEMWLYSNFSEEAWSRIFNNIMYIIEEYKKNSSFMEINLFKFLNDRLFERVSLSKFFPDEIQIINGNEYNLQEIKSFFINYLESKKSEWSNKKGNIIHGDMVFSNIMYDITTDDIKLIDPRGDFNGNIIYGDIDYDIAKLAQCIIGDYDYIVSDLFYLDGDKYSFFLDKDKSFKENLFDDIVKYYNKKDILFLTAFQFMTMIPLHSENENHQIIMRYKAIELLDKCMRV